MSSRPPVKAGFVRIRVNGEIRMLEETDNLNLNKQKWHYIELVVDRIIVRPETELARVAESVETCLREGEGVVEVLRESADGGDSETLIFSEQFACAKCNVSLPEIEPRTFSFNSPHGACSECTGLGYKLAVDPELIIPNKNLSLSEGAITPWVRVGTSGAWYISPDAGGCGGQRFLRQDPGTGTGEGADRPDPLRQRRAEGYRQPPHPTVAAPIAGTPTLRASFPNLERTLPDH